MYLCDLKKKLEHMKRTIHFIAIFIVFMLSVSLLQAQSKLKVGHINSSELLQMMPGKDSAQDALIKYATDLEQQLTMMTNEFETKYQDYLANETKWTQLVKNDKQKELTSLQNRITEFQEQAQEDLQMKEAELIEPLLRKAQDAIQDVAKEKGYTYILDTSSGAVLYFEDSDDILPLVKKKIGIE
jgi:outer membrane protein